MLTDIFSHYFFDSREVGEIGEKSGGEIGKRIENLNTLGGLTPYFPLFSLFPQVFGHCLQGYILKGAKHDRV